MCGIVKFLRHIIYAIAKADIEISAPGGNYSTYKKLGAQVMRQSEN